jgi:hypothetical protein
MKRTIKLKTTEMKQRFKAVGWTVGTFVAFMFIVATSELNNYCPKVSPLSPKPLSFSPVIETVCSTF